MERVLTALSHKEPDRVPLLLLLSLYGAKELEMPVKEYFSRPDLVANAQLLMQKKYRNDCLYTFSYASVEVEAAGGQVIFAEEGPTNSGQPIITNSDQIMSFDIPKIDDSPCLLRVLETTNQLKKKVGDSLPIIGVVMSPFSLPVMQMGFENYLELIYFKRNEFDLLMRKNSAFCVNWANAQLKAGATAICFFNPLASPSIIEKQTYLKTGYPIDVKTIAKIKGATATHLASGITLPVLEEIIQTKTAILGFSQDDDVALLKKRADNKIALMGNLNGVEMVNWTIQDTEMKVKEIIQKAGRGGGLLLADSHGEIPWQVPESVLCGISQTIKKWGNYPLDWIGD